MDNPLVIKAGRTALAHIRENGLRPSDIAAVLGASGAAKWLSIYGLDRMIFSRWLNGISHRIYLLGTSIGAWKLAAAAQARPDQALDCLKDAYIRQSYRGRVTREQVTMESLKILDRFLTPGNIREILDNPAFRLGISAVRCRGLLAMENTAVQAGGMGAAFAMNLFARKTQSLFFQRTLFQVPDPKPCPLDLDDFRTTRVALTPENVKPALLASGSIPIIMEGVTGIPGAPKRGYRDGGLLDYHPAFQLRSEHKGLILYPHFYPDIIPGWFDKKIPGRRAAGDLVDRIVLVSPSPGFVSGLPFGRIPDREDFRRFHGRDTLRFRAWNTAANRSLVLGEAFLHLVESGRIRELAIPF